MSTQDQSDESSPLAKNQYPTIPQSTVNNTTELQSTIPISNRLKWLIFVLLNAVSVLSNIDSGVIPAATQKMEDKMKVAETKIGLFGSMDFLGRVIGSLVYIPIINQINRRYLLTATLIGESISLIIPFFFQSNYIVNLICRIVAGFNQVYFTTYPSVWVNQYGPKRYSTILITIVQSGTVFGILFGFALCTVIGKTYWAVSFLIEAAILTSLGISFLFIPQIYFSNNYYVTEGNDNELKEMDHIEGESNSTHRTKLSQLCHNISLIIKEYVFLFTCLSNCVI